MVKLKTIAWKQLDIIDNEKYINTDLYKKIIEE